MVLIFVGRSANGRMAYERFVLKLPVLSRFLNDFDTFLEETRSVFTDNGGSFNLFSCQDPFEKAVMSFLAAAEQ